jgi:hypothetical protein
VADHPRHDFGVSLIAGPDWRRVNAVRASGVPLAEAELALELGFDSEVRFPSRIEVHAGGIVVVPRVSRRNWGVPRAILATEIRKVLPRRSLGTTGIDVIHVPFESSSPLTLFCSIDHPVVLAIREIAATPTPVFIPDGPGSAERVRWVRSSGTRLAKAVAVRGVFTSRVAEVYPAGIVTYLSSMWTMYGVTAVLASEIRSIDAVGGRLTGRVKVAHEAGDTPSPRILRVRTDSDVAAAVRRIAATPIPFPDAVPPVAVPSGIGLTRVLLATRDDAMCAPRGADARYLGFLPELMPDEWLFRLPAWLHEGGGLQLAVGETATLAVRAVDRGLHRVTARKRFATPLGDGLYGVRAETLYAADDLSVLDFGIAVFLGDRPDEVAVGELIGGEVALEVDSVEFEGLHAARTQIPHALRSWTVTGIWCRPARDEPLFVSGAVATASYAADPARFGLVEVSSTAASADDPTVRGSYLVRARVVSGLSVVAAGARAGMTP